MRKQIDTCVDDIGVDVVKTGMLASAGTVSVVADALRKHGVSLSVVDPVMVATSGARLLPEDAVKTLCDRLLPETFILTPNVPEANLILKEAGQPAVDVTDVDGLVKLATMVHSLGPQYVLLKGGHLPLTKDEQVAKSDNEKHLVVNVLVGKDCVDVTRLQYQASRNTHGTGCSLASAIACQLAGGSTVQHAVKAACRYVEAGIKTSLGLGKGSGPLNHFHSIQTLPFAPGGFIDYVLEREDVMPAWEEYTCHDFTRQLGDGTLQVANYKHYMIQDYLYLIQFARANALAGYKAKNIDDIAGAATIVTHITHEMDLHISECEELGLTKQDLEQCEEDQGNCWYSGLMYAQADQSQPALHTVAIASTSELQKTGLLFRLVCCLVCSGTA